MTVLFARKIVARSELGPNDHHQVIRLWLDEDPEIDRYQYYQVEGYANSTIFVLSKSFDNNEALEKHCQKAEVTEAIVSALQPIIDAFPLGRLPGDVFEDLANAPPPPPPGPQLPFAIVPYDGHDQNSTASDPSSLTMLTDDQGVGSEAHLMDPGNSVDQRDLSTETAITQATQ